ncbi:ATP-binding protein [Candidatus Peregrinibacteria bacterium]|nr:ATP-binding protein [Candidatus Peregrinibacteria bacterium]
MKKKLIKRDILDEILDYIDDDQILVLHGARQVGKTNLLYLIQDFLQKRGNKTFFFDLEDISIVDVLDAGVETVLDHLKKTVGSMDQFKENGKRLYVFIDEIQYLKNPSPLLKLLVDHHKYLKLVVSGSSSFDIKRKFTNSLVGRTFEFEVFNLSFREFLRFKESPYNVENFSIGSNAGPAFADMLRLYREYALFGGYPKVVLEDIIKKKQEILRQIINTYVRKDIRDLAGIRDIRKFNNLLKLLASQSGQMLSVNGLADVLEINRKTAEEYLFILENTYIIKLVYPFSHSAKVEVVKAPKIFFYDTGLLQMLWKRGLEENMVGNIFETSVFAELVKKHGREDIHYWRTRSQTEVDFVLDLRTGVLPVEVKTNFRNFKSNAVSSFCKKYKAKDYKVVGLEGDKRDEHCIYPWEL